MNQWLSNMKTPTHVAINYLLFSKLGVDEKYRKYFLLGAALPDVPICLVFVGIFLTTGNVDETVKAFRALYEGSEVMIGLHNILHSPISLGLLLVVSECTGPYKQALKIFIAGCFTHSLIDIYTHVDDGPLMFWPFDLESRFTSRISHWDPNYSGQWVLITEIGILLITLGWIYYQKYVRPVWGMYQKI